MGRLFWKFFFAFWLTLLLAGVGVGTAVWLHNRSEATGDARLLLGGPRTGFFLNLASAALRNGGPQVLERILREGNAREPQRNPPRPVLFVVDDAGRDLLARPVPPQALADARSHAGDDDEVRHVEVPDGRRYLLFVAADPARMEQRERFGDHHEPPSPLLPVIIGIVASLAFSALLAWYLSMPVRHLRRAFDAVAAGRMETRVAPLMGGRRDEIADLGRDFDRMAQQLQEVIGAQRRLLHDVSHELRSPLARLQAAIGLARQDPAQMEATLERLEREAVRLDTLVGELLTLSRLEAGTVDAPPEQVDLMDLTAAIADDARFEANAHHRDLYFRGEGEAPARVQAELLHRAFENVIRNAVKYTAAGTMVDVEARVEGGAGAGEFHLRVSDRGPGVPDRDLDAIFQPFYRGDQGRAAAGFGLGLAIARRAIQAHGGRIHATNRAGGGLVIEIVLPLNGATADATRPL